MEFPQKTFICCNKVAFLFGGQGKIEAIVSRVLDLDRHSRCRLEQIPHGQQFDFSALEKTGSEQRQARPFGLFSRGCSRTRRPAIGVQSTWPFDEAPAPPPYYGDAGIDNERVHRSSRPSRRRTSDGVCFRRHVSFRRSAASISKEGSASLTSPWRRIFRCAASVERPWRAARRFKRAIRSSSKLRTWRFPGGGMRALIPTISNRFGYVKQAFLPRLPISNESMPSGVREAHPAGRNRGNRPMMVVPNARIIAPALLIFGFVLSKQEPFGL
jgi:hypothetical protein